VRFHPYGHLMADDQRLFEIFNQSAPAQPGLWESLMGRERVARALAEQADPWTMAALRQRQAVQPLGGRQEGAATRKMGFIGETLGNIGMGLATLPQRAYDAAADYERSYREGAPQYNPAPILEGAGLVLGAPFKPHAVNPVAETLASRSASVYNPPAKTPRPFSADYPAGASSDATGRLLADIEGRPLTARYVAGRRVVGGGDEALAPAQYDAVTTSAIGSVPEGVAAGALPRGSVGVYRELRGETAPERSIGFLKSLPPAKAEKVVAHEMGHMIDEIAGRISTAGLSRELAQVYNTLNTGQERTRHLTGPQHLGYQGASVPREYMAEAIRAYMTDPNYLKTVAPKTAAAIREAVNAHPTLSKTIQFNVGGGPMAWPLSVGEDR
jgi:hypothetical protein